MSKSDENKRRVPKLRFPGFTEDWEQRKLGKLVSFSKGSGYSKGDLKEVGTPIILYGRLYTKYETVISEVDTFVDEKAGSVYSKGGEVIVPGSGETAEDISIASVVEKPGILLGGDLNVITPPANLDAAFLAISISNGKPHSDMAKMAQGKSVVHLHNSDLAKIDFPYPSYEEQCKISGYFTNFDHLITLHQRKCDRLKELKKGLLQKMFPKNGEKIPELRFPGFTEDWEQRKLGKLVSFSKGSGYSKGDLKEVGTPIILYGRLYTKYETVISEVDTFVDEKAGSVYSKGGEVIVPGSGETAEDISIASVVEKPGILLGGDLNVITPPANLDAAFLAISISNGKPHSDMAKMAQGKSVVHLHNSDLAKIDFPYPSYEEQCKISGYFTNFDHLITLHQRKLEHLKELKKGLLQQMFV